MIVIKQRGCIFRAYQSCHFHEEGELTPTETTAYYPGLTAVTKRAKNIKLMYEDIDGKQQFLTATDDLAVLIQRKNDYLTGFHISSSGSQLKRKKIFENKLKGLMIQMQDASCNHFSLLR